LSILKNGGTTIAYPQLPLAARQLREPWIDAAKGLIIIAVVFFHFFCTSGVASQLCDLMQWVMMPFFFLMAGYLYRPNVGYTMKRAKRLLLPLLTTITIIYLVFGNDGLLEGENEYVVLWFLPCLLIVQIVFSYLRLLLFPYQAGFILACFIAAHYIPPVLPPWGIDASLAALYYYAIGYYSKNIIKNNKLALFCLLTIIPFVAAQYWQLAYNTLDMKRLYFPNIYFDAIVPVIGSVIIFNIAGLLSRLKLLQYIGESSMMIYLFHCCILFNFNLSAYFQPMIANFILIFLAITIPFMTALLLKNMSERIGSYQLFSLQNKIASNIKIDANSLWQKIRTFL